MKMKKQSKNKGITLIALVITIIVLLILAGVSISTLTGDNGLLTQASKAKHQTKLAELKENLQMDILDVIMKQEGNDLNKEELRNILVKYFGEKNVPAINDLKWDNFPEGFELTTEDGEYTVDIAEIYDKNLGKMTAGTETTKPVGNEWKEGVKAVTDGEGNIIPVPEGFSYKEGTKETGFVIADGKGNEFVWIPCTLDEYKKAKNLVMTEQWLHNQEYETNGGGTGDGTKWSDDYTQEDLTNINAKYGTEASETISDITANWENHQTTVAEGSIGKYEGFYIARYEAGIPNEATAFYTDPNGEDLQYKKDETGLRGATNETGLNLIKDLAPVSKKGVQAWNFITQPNAKIVAENMYKTSNAVGSYLVDSQAWNHICKNIFKAKSGQTANDSTKWGNYNNNNDINIYSKINNFWALHTWDQTWSYAKTYEKRAITQEDLTTAKNRIELATGSSDSFKNYNIYDMAGNMWEWTTGHNINQENKTMFVVPRGGSFDPHGAYHPVVRANGGDVLADYGIHVGFRVVLYVK